MGDGSESTGLGPLVGPGLAHRLELVAALAATRPGPARGPGPASPPSPLSGQSWGRSRGLSRAAVHKHIEHLRGLGFAIDPVGGAGYRLTAPFDDLVVAEAVLPYLLGLWPEGLGPATAAAPASTAVTAAAAPAATAAAPAAGVRPASVLVGLPYHYRASCESTNSLAKQMAAPGGAGRGSLGAPAGTVVVTDRQTGGRGRLGRTWVSEAGKDLTFSVILRPAVAPAVAHLLSLAAGVAVAEVLEDHYGLAGEVSLKWPNDVLLAGGKLCGILLEGSMDADRLHWAVAGIGLNVNGAGSALPEQAAPERRGEWAGRPRPVSLAEHVGRPVPRAPLLAALLKRLGAWWEGIDEPERLLAAWRRRDALAGRAVEVVSGLGRTDGPRAGRAETVVRGVAAGIGGEGQLLVREEDGRVVPVFAGDVTVRGAAAAAPAEAT